MLTREQHEILRQLSVGLTGFSGEDLERVSELEEQGYVELTEVHWPEDAQGSHPLWVHAALTEEGSFAIARGLLRPAG